jgi:sugar O-acyltransferase (sialic acid O-acetyltransferase NeuD family)
MTESLINVGAGGFARETAQAVRAAGVHTLLGFLDDDPAKHGTKVDGVPVLGGSALLADHPSARVLVCVGSARDYAARARVVERLGLPDERYATVVHPSASVPDDCELGAGTVLLAQVVLTAAVRVGRHVSVMPQTVLTHDDVVEDFATLASGVRLSGGVRVGRGAYLGAGVLVREQLSIGAWSLVGIGGVVLSDVPAGQVWVGSPARRLRSAPSTAWDQLRLMGAPA